MKKEPFVCRAYDGKILAGFMIHPESEPKAALLFIHGLGEHCGRFVRWAGLFAEQGYLPVCYDLRGHGKSGGRRGHIRSYKDYLKDIDNVIEQIRLNFGDIPVVLYGHSMGGNLAINYTISKNAPIQALIVSAPWLRLGNEPPGYMMRLARILKKFIPWATSHNRVNGGQLSHNGNLVEKYREDPLSHSRLSLNLFFEVHEHGLHALRNIYKINKPFLIMHGQEDTITSPRASKNYVMNTSDLTRLKIWEGMYHELHNEENYREVFEYVKDWLESIKL